MNCYKHWGGSMLKEFFTNFTIVATFLFLIGQLFRNHSFTTKLTLRIQIRMGVIFGFLGILLILYSIHVTDKIIVDLRYAAILCSALLGGPISTLLTSVIIGIYRFIYGGITNVTIIAVINILVAGIGCAVITKSKISKFNKYFFMNIVILITTMIAWLFLVPDRTQMFEIWGYFYPVTILGAIISIFMIQNIIASNSNLKSMMYYRVMADNLSDMISTKNTNGVYVYVSPSSIKLTGYDPDELIGVNVFNLVHPEDLEMVKRFLEGDLKNSECVTYEYRIRTKKGGYIWVETASKLICNKDDSVKEVISVTRDITIRKHEQNQLEKINEELKLQRIQAEFQRVAAVEASQHKSQFLANMSHELRTPLNSVIGFTNRVIKKTGDILPPMQLENLVIVKEEALHLLDLINSLLDYSKIEAGKMEIHLEPFNLIHVIDEVSNMMGNLLSEKGLNYQTVLLQQGSIEIKSDRIKVKQILINLLSNAIKYSERGTITLAVENMENSYLIKVIDEGIGIDPEDIENIFDEFRQVDGSYTRKVGGTGLGLSITRKFSELLGGQIEVESKLGVGSCFTVRIPRETLNRDVIGFRTESNVNKKRIVCVDDDPNVQRLYKQYLDESEFETIILNGDEDVATQITEMMPDAIVLDIMLPKKDGWEILSELKGNKTTKKIPVIMASVLSEKNLAFKMKADDYLIKPVTQEELIDTLVHVISKKSNIELLVADDDENFLNLIGQFLSEESIHCRFARDGVEVLDLMKEQKPDLLILDIMMPRKDGFSVVDEIKKNIIWADVPIIVVTAKDLSNKEKEELKTRVNMVIQKLGSNVDSVMEAVLNKIKEKINVG